MSATHQPEPDLESLALEALEASETLAPEASVKAALKYFKATRESEQQRQRDEARAKVEAEMQNIRQLDAEATVLTRNLKRYF